MPASPQFILLQNWSRACQSFQDLKKSFIMDPIKISCTICVFRNPILDNSRTTYAHSCPIHDSSWQELFPLHQDYELWSSVRLYWQSLARQFRRDPSRAVSRSHEIQSKIVVTKNRQIGWNSYFCFTSYQIFLTINSLKFKNENRTKLSVNSTKCHHGNS